MISNQKVLTIGDAMITMNPTSTGPLRFVSTFERKVGGAELNFAIGCARLGLDTAWISRLGDDEFGRVIYNFARGEGVNVDHVKFVEGHPTSINFKEIREDGSGKTFYYRYHSPVLSFRKEQFRKELFQQVDLLHISGVFMAIDPQNVELIHHIVKLAKASGTTVSFDPNLRLKLWTIEEARAAYAPLWEDVDIVLTGLDEIDLLLGTSDKESLAAFSKKHAIQDFVIKDGENGSQLFTNDQWLQADSFKVQPIDTVGAGDGFDAAYIYSYLKRLSPVERLRVANGAGALVTTVSGDNEGLPYLEELNRFINRESVIER